MLLKGYMLLKPGKLIIYAVVFVYAALCLLPFLMVISGSLSNEADIIKHGYRLIPRHPDLISYRILFMNINAILSGYKISIIVTVTGTLLSLLVNAMMAYAMSHTKLKYRKFLSTFSLITILFNGGMVPWYIVCVNYLHLKDNIIALILPYLANAWYIFLLRNYMQTIPKEMHESAKIDGAREFRIFFNIILRLSYPVLAAVGLFTALMYWNDWWLGLMLLDKNELKPLQLLLRAIVSNVMFLQTMQNAAQVSRITGSIPSEGIKMAVCVITIGPVIFLYPFIQKYFMKGIMIGAVKG